MRPQKTSRFGRKAVVLGVMALAVLVSATSPAGPVLFRIARADAAKMSAESLIGFVVIQELADSLLAVGPAAFPESLAAAGIAADILDADIRGKAYFLVHTPQPKDIAALGRVGTAILLDQRTCLFWTDAGEARDILMPRFRIKRLDVGQGISWSPPTGGAEPGPDAPAVIIPDPQIFEWVAQVSKNRLTETIQSLQNFQTRYASTVACENSGTFLYNAFAQIGLACEYETFTFSGAAYATRNIIATLPGKSNPNKVVIVCAHYDSYSNKASTLAPGADDNASGTAAVLEIAQVLAAASLDYTVKFICFSAEEWGLYGSRYYAQRAKSRQENIVGVINMDMISYSDTANPILEVYVNPSSNWLGNRYLEAASVYAPMPLSKILDSSATWSDHSSFWDQSFSAVCGIEESADRNPYYHRTSDTLDKLNMNFCLSSTRASLAAAADLARPSTDRPQPPTGLQAWSQIVGSLFSSVKSVLLQWNAGPETVAGYNVYRSITSGGGYEKINPEPLRQPVFSESMLNPYTTYYYVVTVVDNQGRESEYSDEVRDDQNNSAFGG